MTAPTRRTQAERREATIAKLVTATIEAIEEVGYHRTSLNEICARSGISKGGMFRHFDTRLDVVVAAAEEVGRRHMAAFRDLATTPPGPADLVRYARSAIRHETNVVWFELLVAARTEPDLRERLAPVARALIDDVETAAIEALPDTVPPDLTRLITTSLLHMFDGESIFRHTYPRPALEEQRLDQAIDLLTHLTTTSHSAT
ncbi:TetR/AcrR family transcriptional regulator [Nocardia takedensis]|uniref:TetR/AcrR family transcriptional regulator n=1 Tax=Nocardia takedensis TaxID=259390 RepID=UPI0002F92868|nr:TetR/AcrR family transcriptional regulator [Nocardia takedensis]